MSLYQASKVPHLKGLPTYLRHIILCRIAYRYRHYCLGHLGFGRIKRYGPADIRRG